MKKILILFITLLTTSATVAPEVKHKTQTASTVQLKKPGFGFSLQGSSCLKTSMGPIEAARKIGVDNIMILDCFGKSYGNNMQAFAQQCSKIIHNNNGITNLNLCVSSAPFDELTPEMIAKIPVEGGNAGSFVNRFAPGNEAKYKLLLQSLIDNLNALKLMPYISWSLWQEPMAKKYYWGTFADFKKYTKIKSDILSTTGRPIYLPHPPVSLLMNPDFLGRRFWYDWMVNDSDSIYARPNHYFSTSFYFHAQAGDWNWLANSYPTQFKHAIIAEYNLSADKAAETQINSPLWTVKFVELLQGSSKNQWDLSHIYFFTLLDCLQDGTNGAMASWAKTPPPNSHFVAKPLWYEIVKVVDVIKDGYEPTLTGIRGTKKEIVVQGDNYTIINR